MDGQISPPALMSMTGFAALTGTHDAWSWTAELRAVNGKGLDLRLRVPDWIEGLEPTLRAKVAARVKRGSLSFNIRLSREDSAGLPRVSQTNLNAILTALAKIEAQAMDHGVSLAPSTATQIAGLRGVLDTASPEEDTGALRAALMRTADDMLDGFEAMRAAEGASLAQVLTAQLDGIDDAVTRAAAAAEERQDRMAGTLRRNLAKVMDTADAEPARVAQELALIVVKADITEELDRLRTHVTAARELLSTGGPVGRKLDFLMQEFNREANTLCSKAQDSALTQIGLDLKVTIDQMREQVQNVE